MEKHFMIDIETTGINPLTEDLLQIGVLELSYDGRFWIPGRTFEILQRTNRQPTSEFAKKHMAELYARCNATEGLHCENIRGRLVQFFAMCGAQAPNVYLMGWNASNFDIPFLTTHGYLIPTSYLTGPDGKDTMVGDFHYRIYELGGSVSLAQNALGYTDRKALLEAAEKAYPELELPAGKEHDALYDCYKQTRLLNGLIRLSRGLK